MVFSSMIFLWVFLPILLGIYFISKDKYRNIILLLFSLLFYSWGEPKYIVVMLISIFANYILGLIMDKYKFKKIILILSIIFNLGLLFYFKYYDFTIFNLNKYFNFNLSLKNIVLPIGISFYTFQSMSYIIDLYRGKIKVQKNLLLLSLYVSFFPQLIAGPIVKYSEIEKQLRKRDITISKFSIGVRRFVYGLGKKVIIANTMAYIADIIFGLPISDMNTLLAWFGAICYTLQIYYDFSGYSDMAIGLGKMFGFDFLENFNLPYISKSITEFWRRWHISLSSWFKEYLYVPLGGNRKGKFRTYINLFIVFLATGIWHGAAWTFIAWGLFNGLFNILEKLFLGKLLEKNKVKIINYIYTMLVVIFGWVLFRSESLDYAIEYYKKMIIFDNSTVLINMVNLINLKTMLIFAIGIICCGPVQILIKKLNVEAKLKNIYSYVEFISVSFIMLICIMMLVSNTYNPFIYFRF